MTEQGKIKDWIKYFNDDGTEASAFVTDVKVECGTISFNNGQNRITIPAHRLIKLKQRGVGDGKE